jgi:hypothetical protein
MYMLNDMRNKFNTLKITALLLLVLSLQDVFAQLPGKLPQSVFIQLIQNTEKMELNHAAKFEHVSLPQKYHNTFLSYVKDSVASPTPGLSSPLYYQWQLKDGRIINGDVYWNEQHSYIIFNVDEKKYINYFSRDGVQQLKSLFKL